YGCHESYAKHNEAPVEESIKKVDINPEFIHQNEMYQSSKYNEGILKALRNNDKIKKILNKYRSEDLGDDWLPTSIYCSECGKDTIISQSFNDPLLEYECKCGNKDKVDVNKASNVKLKWRVDWPMRWAHEDVVFEPGGKDHSTQGGSRDTGKIISEEIYDKKAPVYMMYDFVKIKGGAGKISSSEGDVITLNDVLEVYEPEIVRWIFASKRANTEFSISFDFDVFKVYDDFEKTERIYYDNEGEENEKEKNKQKAVYELSLLDKIQDKQPIQVPFRHFVTLIQVNEGDVEKTFNHFENKVVTEFDKKRIKKRIRLAKNWVEKYAPDKVKFKVRDKIPKEDKKELKEKVSDDLKEVYEKILKELKEEDDDEELHQFFYETCKEHNVKLGKFFKISYQIILGKSRGPRLAGFMIDLGHERIKNIFDQIL
ncbi:MAG: lysine--tRNA ligase, partial [Candidatus Woesearchaeota archaeon]